MPLQLDDLAALDAPSLQHPGVPLRLSVDAIDEDPEQPRREFDANALEELAQTIRERGVRQPISVRPNLQVPQRWILNFGARRLRACKLAGVTDIPAFIDTSADSYDQVIENEQREGLTPLELALFVQKRLARGDTKTVIGKRLGKSKQWVTLATALIEAPDWLMQAYRDGRCRGMNELYELRRLEGEHGRAVEAWAEQQEAITRDRLVELRSALDAPETASQRAGLQVGAAETGGRTHDVIESAAPVPQRATRRAAAAEPRVHVELDGHDYQLVVSVVPPQPGCMYVRPLSGGPRRLAKTGELKLRGFVGA